MKWFVHRNKLINIKNTINWTSLLIINYLLFIISYIIYSFKTVTINDYLVLIIILT